MSYNYNSQTGTYHASKKGSYQHTQYSNTGYVNSQNYPQQGYASNGNTFNSNTWDLGTSFTSPMPTRQAPSIPDQTHTAGYFSSQYGKSPMEDFNLEDSAPLKEKKNIKIEKLDKLVENSEVETSDDSYEENEKNSFGTKPSISIHKKKVNSLSHSNSSPLSSRPARHSQNESKPFFSKNSSKNSHSNEMEDLEQSLNKTSVKDFSKSSSSKRESNGQAFASTDGDEVSSDSFHSANSNNSYSNDRSNEYSQPLNSSSPASHAPPPSNYNPPHANYAPQANYNPDNAPPPANYNPPPGGHAAQANYNPNYAPPSNYASSPSNYPPTNYPPPSTNYPPATNYAPPPTYYSQPQPYTSYPNPANYTHQVWSKPLPSPNQLCNTPTVNHGTWQRVHTSSPTYYSSPTPTPTQYSQHYNTPPVHYPSQTSASYQPSQVHYSQQHSLQHSQQQMHPSSQRLNPSSSFSSSSDVNVSVTWNGSNASNVSSEMRDAKGKVIMVQITLMKSSNVSVNTISQDSWLRLHYAFTNLLENGDTVVAQLMLDYDRALHMSNVIILLDNELRGWVNMKLKENSHKGFVCHTRVQLGKTDPCLIEEAKKWNSHFLVMEEHSSSSPIQNTLKSIQSSWKLPNVFKEIGEKYSRNLHPQCNLLIMNGEICKWQRFPFTQNSNEFTSRSEPIPQHPPPIPNANFSAPIQSQNHVADSANKHALPTWDQSNPNPNSTEPNFPMQNPIPSPNPNSDWNRFHSRSQSEKFDHVSRHIPPPIHSQSLPPNRNPPSIHDSHPIHSSSLPPNRSPPPVPDSPLSSDRSFNLRESSTWDESSNDFSKQPSAKSETSKNFTSPSQTKSSNSSSDSNRRSSFLDKESEVCSNANFSKMFTYEEVEEATEGFSRERKIGEGGFGEVYLGISANLGKIAVKVIKQKVKEHALQQLETELSLMQKINHKNVVKLLGFCVTEENLILVFEFVDGGSLKSRIRNSKLPPLTWMERVKIIQGSAEGLRYLHEGLSQPIIHRDIKSDNILITNTLIPKIADFGLAKETPEDQAGTWIFPETLVIGSYGYIAPEYVSNQQGTKSIDVFAFGVIILELLTGRPAYIKSLNPPALRDHVKQVLSSEESVLVLADPRLEGDFDAEQFKILIDVGMQCCKNNPKKRLKMEDVALQLALLTLKY